MQFSLKKYLKSLIIISANVTNWYYLLQHLSDISVYNTLQNASSVKV